VLAVIVDRRFPFRVDVRGEICDFNVNGLVFLVFWWNRAHPVGNFIACLRNVFAFNAKTSGNRQKLEEISRKLDLLGYVNEDVVAALNWGDEAVTFAATKCFDGAENQRISHRTIRAV
jgi:hypothetical protein